MDWLWFNDAMMQNIIGDHDSGKGDKMEPIPLKG